MEDFDQYRTICANRLRRLERYKKAQSFCNLEFDETTDKNDPITGTTPTEQSTAGPSTFDLIREKMFSLMENDMSLLQQLLSLGDQINEMKKQRLRRTVSHSSIDDDSEEKDDQFEEGFSASMSAVTNLYVDDDRPQFFSRQNSVLRIPIPPRSSNRFGPRRIIRRPSDIMRHSNIRSLRVNSEEEESEGSRSPPTVSPKSGESHTPYNSSTMSSNASVAYSTTSSSSSTSSVELVTKNRSSNSSIDSGIRDSSPSSYDDRIVG